MVDGDVQRRLDVLHSGMEMMGFIAGFICAALAAAYVIRCLFKAVDREEERRC